VISRKDIEHLYLHHVLHSLSIAKVIQFKPGTKVLDIGTGGGFPGIPLAIMFPDSQFHLVDSIKKKITVVQAVIDALGLKNATAEWNRAENVSGKYHFVTSRAVNYLKTLYTWSKKKISDEQFNDFKNGLLVLKGGDLNDELDSMDTLPQLYLIKSFFKEEYFDEKWVVYMKS
jgi:16S rRNA (guanine527-N7)-methyltransferase